jgi:xanthine dehydrogenase YagS FAD-binding subunit
MRPFQYIRPKTVAEAIDAAESDSQARFIAGGTNLLDLMKRGISSPQKLIDINHLPLKKIDHKNGLFRIGSGVLNSELVRHPKIVNNFPLLVQAVNAGASGQLRNMATVGGNLLQQTRCSYFYDTAFPCNKRKPGEGCSALNGINRLHAILGIDNSNLEKSCIAVHASDMAVALTSLDARVVLMNKNGERKLLLPDLYRPPGDQPDMDTNLVKGELISAVELPDIVITKYTHYLKVRDRSSYAFALISAAVALDIEGNRIRDARITMGGVAYKPWRLPAVEKMLIGQPVSKSIFRQAGEASLLGAHAFEHNSYKLKLMPNIIAEALRLATEVS